MNGFLLFFLLILVLEIAVCTSLKYNMWASDTIGNKMCTLCVITILIDVLLNTAHAWYLNANHTAPVRDVLQDVFSFLIVFNYIIPISLYVTLGSL